MWIAAAFSGTFYGVPEFTRASNGYFWLWFGAISTSLLMAETLSPSSFAAKVAAEEEGVYGGASTLPEYQATLPKTESDTSFASARL